MAKPSKPPLPKAMQALLKRAGAPPKTSFTAGAVVGRYRVGEQIGQGGHGVVYRAVEVESGTPVAIKVLHEEGLSEDLKLRMKREAYAMHQLVGTAAAHVYECSESASGQLFLVMEFLEGKDLSGIIASYEDAGSRVPISVVVKVLVPIVRTLAAAHERGIIHRDLKPENIFVLNNGSIRLVDFGLVKDLNLAKLTEAGTVVGSPGFIAPEAWAGRPDQIDQRIDVYSLGVLVFRMLGGRRPFEPGSSMMDFILTVSGAPRPSLHALRGDLHPSIDHWVRRALAVEPAERFQTVVELWDALMPLLNRAAQ